jgi:hypothetical protein
MKLLKLAVTACAAGLLSVGASAQEKPGNIASLEFQTPKNGMVKQYEEGRKAKALWHKQQKDTQPLLVSEILTLVSLDLGAPSDHTVTDGPRCGDPRRTGPGHLDGPHAAWSLRRSSSLVS